jgi:tetratricopeptide (TPR) repeat protein
VAWNQIASCYEGLGDWKQALASYGEGRKIYLELAAADPANVTVQSGLAIADANVGSMLVKTGSARQGLALMDDAVRRDEALIAADPAGSVERNRLAQFYAARAEAREGAGMAAGALSDFQKALAVYQAQAEQNPGNAMAQMQVARGHLPVARLSARIGLRDQAEANFQKALDLAGKYAEAGAARPGTQQVAAEASAGLGNIASARGSDSAQPMAQRISQLNAARSYYLKSLGLWQSIGRPGTTAPGIADCNRQLARIERTIASLQNP